MLAVTLLSIFFNHNNFFLTYHATFFIFQLLFKHKSWNPNQEPVNQVFLGVNQFRHYLRSIQTEQVNCHWWLILIQMLHQLPQLSWSKNQNNFGKNLQNTYKYSSAKIITPPRRFSSFQRGTVGLCKSKAAKFQGVRVGGLKKICCSSALATSVGGLDSNSGWWNHPQSLTNGNFAPLWHTETGITLLERSKRL